MQSERVAVQDLFQRVIDRHLPDIQRKQIGADVAVDPATPPLVGSAARLEQAIQNLAANAIRHMPEGGRLSLVGEPVPAGVRLIVRDTGPGISAEHLPHIFGRFYKADGSRAGTKIPSGSGLGLSIVQAIVRHHGGEITAGNAAGGGAEFTILLPAQETATTERAYSLTDGR